MPRSEEEYSLNHLNLSASRVLNFPPPFSPSGYRQFRRQIDACTRMRTRVNCSAVLD